MTRKEAFLRSGEKAFDFCSMKTYNRSEESRWYKDYTEEQMKYLWDHNYIMYTTPIYRLGENDRNKYIQFTESGKRWREWYEVSHWNWFKYNVLGYMFWEYSVYYPIRKYVFRKPYPWEGYENVDIDNI